MDKHKSGELRFPATAPIVIVTLGFAGVYLIIIIIYFFFHFLFIYFFFIFLIQNIECGYSLEAPRRGGSNSYPHSMFLAKLLKMSKMLNIVFCVFVCLFVLI